jgi:hypothetical protein
LEFKVRPVFTIKVSCERENPKADCIPLTPIEVRFSAPVAWDQAQQVVLEGPNATAHKPKTPNEPVDFVTSLSFAPPFAESSTLTVVLPADLHDDAGRPLAARNAQGLAVKTAPFPPLAKFAARFGILEARAEPALPVTIRNLDPTVQGQQLTVTQEPIAGWRDTLERLYARLGGSVRPVPPDQPTLILPWLRALATARRSTSIFAGSTPTDGEPLTTFTLSQPDGPQTMQVVGIPFQAPGFYVVELASPRLGAALLDKNQPMYVPAGALVTNLSVHLEWANESALVWVTTLDHAQPVAGARIAVQDCNGSVIGSGQTDDDGLLRLTGLPDDEHAPRCYKSERFEGFDGLDYRVLRRQGTERIGRRAVRHRADRQRSELRALVVAGRHRAVALPVAIGGLAGADRRAHDFRSHAVSRRRHRAHETRAAARDDERVRHGRSSTAADDGDRSPSRQRRDLRAAADLGCRRLCRAIVADPVRRQTRQYDVSLKSGDQQWTSGSFRLEQFAFRPCRRPCRCPPIRRSA